MPGLQSTLKEFPITFEKGLVTEIEASTLDLGQASALLNWEPTAQGGLRARNAWSSISTLGLPAGYKIRGFGSIAANATVAAAPSIVQSSHWPNGTAAAESTKTLTLTGVTIGDVIAAVVGVDSAADPTSISPGFVEQGSTTTGIAKYTRMYTKVATSTTESFTITYSTAILHMVSIFELKNVSATATATDLKADSTSNGNLSVTSSGGVAGVGIVVIASPTATVSSAVAGGTSGWSHTQKNHKGTSYYVYEGTYTGSGTATETITLSQAVAHSTRIMIFDFVEPPAPPDAVDFYIVIAVETATGYSIYRILRDEITTGTWSLLDSATTTDATRRVMFSQGAGYLVWSASSLTTPRSILLSGPTPANITDLTNKAGRAVCYHKDRMFSAGSNALPSRLYFSAIGNPTSWTTAVDYLDVGGDDGEAIQDLVSVEGLLLVCKTNRLYLISGSGIESFFVNEVSGGTTAAGRGAVRTPYGTIVAGTDDIWVLQGGVADPMSRPLGADYKITGTVSTAYAQDSAWIADSGSGRCWRVNLVTGSWSEDEARTGSNQIGEIFGLNGRLYYGVINSTSQVGGTRRLSSDRSYDVPSGTGSEFAAATGRLSLLGPSYKYTPRFLFMQLRLHDTAHPNTLHVVIESNVGSEEQAILVTDSTQRSRLDLGRYKGAEWIKLSYSADSSMDHAAIDVEKTVLGVLTENYR